MAFSRRGSERFLTTVLFTDIVGSTEHAAELGDNAWRNLVQVHHAIVRAALRRHGGREIDTAGDGFFAVFDAPAEALECALDIVAGVRDLGLEVRAGAHVGEVEEVAGKVGGITVPIGSRIMAAAAPGEVLVSATVRDLAAGAGLHFRDHGVRELKGVPGDWHLSAVTRIEREGAGRPVGATAPERASRRAAAVRRARARPIWQRRPRLTAGGVIGIALALLFGGALVVKPWQPRALAAVAENSIGIVDAERAEVIREIPVRQRPGGIAVGEGAVWVTNTGTDSISQIDLRTRSVVNDIPVGRDPTGIVAAEGSIWVANSGERTLSRINAATGRMVDAIAVGNGPTAVAFGAGSLWVANASDSTVVQVDTDRGTPDRPIPVAASPSALAADDAGVWVVSEDAGTITHLDPRTGVTVAAPIPVGTRPTAVALGAGSVWVANGDGTVSRLDPIAHRVTATVAVGGSLSAIVATEDAVWVADVSGAVYRLQAADPFRPPTRIATSSAPQALAWVEGEIWIATRPSRSAHRGGTLRIVSLNRPLSLDPVDVTASQIVGLEADGLLGYRRVGGIGGSTLLPALATSIPRPTDGGKSYTFQVRPGLMYADGQPLRAADFRRGIERFFQVSDPFLGAPPGNYYGSLLGADDCEEGPVQRCDLSAGIVVDDSSDTVTFHLAKPDPDLLYKLALPFAFPVPDGVPMNESVQGAFPGTGPYSVSAWNDTEVRLVRNTNFRSWDPDVRPDGFPDEIVWTFGVDKADGAEMIQRGEADYLALRQGTRLRPDLLARLRAEYTGQLHFGSVSVVFAFMNPALPPFDKLQARQAVSLAIDRAHIAELYGGSPAVSITCQVLPPAWPSYEPYCPYTTRPDPGGQWKGSDPATAERLIDASGTRGASVAVGPVTARYSAIAEHLADVLGELGYDASVDPATDDEDVFTAVFQEKRVQIGVFEWLPDILAPATFLGGFSCADGHGVPDHCDPALDALIAEARALQTTDPAAAAAKWAEVDRAVVDLALWAPLFNDGADFVSERVGNYQFHPAYLVLVDQLWVQ